MTTLRNHIVIQVLAIFIGLVILAPSVVKTVHSLIQHEHLDCDSQTTTHFHDKELECKFDKFQLNKQLFWTIISLSQTTIAKENITPIANLHLIYYDQLRSFSLRAPPSFILA